MERFKEKVIVVTGAAAGMGAEAVKTLHKEGAYIVAADKNPAIETLYSDLENVDSIIMDVTVNEDVDKVFSFVENKFGKLDGVLHFAGASICPAGARIHTIDIDKIELCVNVNALGTARINRAAAELMVKTGSKGCIVNTSSASAMRAFAGAATYASSKAFVNWFTKNIALDYAENGIRVNVVVPGFVPGTDFYGKFSADKMELYSNVTPISKIGTAEDIINGALWLLSDEACWVTGHELVIDGGNILSDPPRNTPGFVWVNE